MEANICGINADVLLPPRKRLLAELKKQNSDELKKQNSDEVKKPNSVELKKQNPEELENQNPEELENQNPEELENQNSEELRTQNSEELKKQNQEELKNQISEELKSQNSEELKKQNSDGNPHMPLVSSTSSEFDIRLNNLLRSYLNKPNISTEEILETSKSAAEAAVKVAMAARAAAEEKAVVASKAMAAAKSALELVATVSEKATSRGKYLKKNKMKSHSTGEMLYKNKHKAVNCKTDEELARKIHRAINSSPRISKNSSTSDLKSPKHKRLKSLSYSSKGIIVREGNDPSLSNGVGIAGELNSAGTTQEVDRLKMGNGDVIASHSKENMEEASEDTPSYGRKRGRIKQKMLSLSNCEFRAQANPKEGLSCTEGSVSKVLVGNQPLFSVGPSSSSVVPIERASTWKCNVFEAPACVKQNQVMQS